jgi:hypothetical protein
MHIRCVLLFNIQHDSFHSMKHIRQLGIRESNSSESFGAIRLVELNPSTKITATFPPYLSVHP